MDLPRVSLALVSLFYDTEEDLVVFCPISRVFVDLFEVSGFLGEVSLFGLTEEALVFCTLWL